MTTHTIHLSDAQVRLLENSRLRAVELQDFIKINSSVLADPSHPDYLHISNDYSVLFSGLEQNFAAFGRACSDQIEL